MRRILKTRGTLSRGIGKYIEQTVHSRPIDVELGTAVRTGLLHSANVGTTSDREMRRHDIAADHPNGSSIRLGDWDRCGKRIEVRQDIRQRTVCKVHSSASAGIAAAPFSGRHRAVQ